MRSAALARTLPVALLVLGAVLSIFVASRVSRSSDREQLAAQASASALVMSQAHDIENQLRAQVNAIEALANSLTVTDDVEAQVEASGAFTRGSAIRAVFSRQGDDVTVVSSGDSVESRDIPLVKEGLTTIESGIWSNSLSFGLDTERTAGAEVVVLVDRQLLVEGLEASPTVEIDSLTIIGLPGDETAATETSDLVEYPNGVFRFGEQGPALAVVPTTILGHDVSLEVMVAASDVWMPSSETLLVGMVGVFVTLVVAGAAWFVRRSREEAAMIRQNAELALDAAATRFRAGFTHAPIGVVELASDGTIIAANPRFASQLGYAPEELETMDVLDVIDGDDRLEAAEMLDQLLNGGLDSEQADRRYRDRNGNAVWVRESMSALVSEDGTRHVLIQAEDISDERRTQAELHRKALFDDLTGLPNRANLIARLNRVLEGDRSPGDLVAVMFVDLDKFKQVNDTLGHEAGDLLLTEVAARLKHACRSSDTVARLGGDEFVVVCEGLPDVESAEQTADRFVRSLQAPMFIDDVEVPISASIGLVINSDAKTPDDVLKQADQAMYRAKASGRNKLIRFDIHTAADDDDPGRAIDVSVDDLRTAIRKRQLRLQYQPVVRSGDGEIVGLEALVRWDHPQFGLLTPPSFLPLAEELGIVEKIDAWVLKHGLEALGRWTAESEVAKDWYLIFNLAPTNFNRRDFVASLESYLEQAGVAPDRIVLERNEVWFMNQTPTAVLSTRQLRALGVRISLDHFGTGSSSLNEVSTLEFDLLKIDRSFVRDATGQSSYVLEALKNMADALGLKAIVEGIETEAELKVVRKAGIEFGQGFHLCRPLDEETLVREHVIGSVSVSTDPHQVAEGSTTTTS